MPADHGRGVGRRAGTGSVSGRSQGDPKLTEPEWAVAIQRAAGPSAATSAVQASAVEQSHLRFVASHRIVSRMMVHTARTDKDH